MLKKSITYLVLFLLATGLVLVANNFFSKPDPEFERRIQKLQFSADSLLKENEKLNLELLEYDKRLTQLGKELEAKDIKINEIKKDVEKNIANINTASYYELVKFFTDRYDSSFSTRTDSTFNN